MARTWHTVPLQCQSSVRLPKNHSSPLDYHDLVKILDLVHPFMRLIVTLHFVTLRFAALPLSKLTEGNL